MTPAISDAALLLYTLTFTARVSSDRAVTAVHLQSRHSSSRLTLTASVPLQTLN